MLQMVLFKFKLPLVVFYNLPKVVEVLLSLEVTVPLCRLGHGIELVWPILLPPRLLTVLSCLLMEAPVSQLQMQHFPQREVLYYKLEILEPLRVWIYV